MLWNSGADGEMADIRSVSSGWYQIVDEKEEALDLPAMVKADQDGKIMLYNNTLTPEDKNKVLSINGLQDQPEVWMGKQCLFRYEGFFRNYPFLLLFVYLNFASSNCLPQRPYIDLFIIFNLLLVPSTKPLLKLYATAFSTASISRFNPSAKLFSALILLLLYFSTNK